MKYLNINASQIGLVFKNGAYKKMLSAGNYWLWTSQKIMLYNTNQPFIPPVDLNVLLQDAELAERLHVVDVAEAEMVLVYENEILTNVLQTGKYAFWKNAIIYNFVKVDVSNINIDEKISRATLQNKLILPFVRSYTIESFEQAVLLIDGKYTGILMPGVYYWWKNSIPVNIAKTDMRTQQMELNGQEILTRDKAALRINGYAQYRVINIEQAILQNKEFEKQLYVNVQLALRDYVSAFNFDELLEKKETVAPFILEAVKTAATNLGVEVFNFGIKDIILPGDMKDIMNKVLIAEKNAQANSIMRREETAGTRSLLNTAKLMEDNVMLWKLKEMEYVEKIAEKIGGITLNGSGLLAEQMKQIFVTSK